MFIWKTKKHNKTYYAIASTSFKKGDSGSRIIKYIGSAEKLYRDLRELDSLRERYNFESSSDEECSQPLYLPHIGQAFIKHMQEKGLSCNEVAHRLSRSLHLKKNYARLIITRFRQGYPFPSKGNLLESNVHRNLTITANVLRAGEIPENHSIVGEINVLFPDFSYSIV